MVNNINTNNSNVSTTAEAIQESKWSRSNALKKAQQKYYVKNKKKITDAQLEYNLVYVRKPFLCPCGDEIKISGKYYHLRSARHNRRMKNIADGIPACSQNSNLKYNCECGATLLNKNKSTHNKSSKHIDYMKSKLLPVPVEEEEHLNEIENIVYNEVENKNVPNNIFMRII